MCIEPLIGNIKHNHQIKEIESNKLKLKLPKVHGFADDVLVVLKSSQTGLQQIFFLATNVLEKFWINTEC